MKIAFSEALRRGGPGHLLFNSILEECAGNQIPELFFGGTKDSYKELWTQQTLPHFRGLVFAPGFRSQLACQIRTKVFPLLSKLRRNLRDRLGRHNQRRSEPGTQSNPGKKAAGPSHPSD
jgi:CelD/BcsL family acetyltransferase involved in cellulose biosynthesis